MRQALLLSFIVICAQLTFAQKESRPNIIYIMADDLGYADLSCFGRKDYQTPELDKLCSQGMKFMNAYANAPVCTPTRVAFFTGRYSARTPVGLREPLDWVNIDSSMGLSVEHPTLPSLLKKSGYETFLVGKWHLGFDLRFSPTKHGFDEFFGFNGGGIDYISHTDPFGNGDLYENEKRISKDGYLTDLLSERAEDVIRRKHGKPFFLCLMLNAPHWPWQAPGDSVYAQGFKKWQEGGSPATYAGMVKNMDVAIGRIVQAVDDMKLSNNTVIIFTSDNGGEKYSDQGPYQGRKMTLWEGGIRVPAIVRWTGTIGENSVSRQVVTTFDWTATILSLAKGKADPNFPMDGIDLTPFLKDPAKEIGRTLYWRISQRRDHKTLRDVNWKYLKDEKGNEYLFDLSIDPTEKTNLKDTYPDILNNLKSKYSKWEAIMLKPIPLGG